MGEDCDRCAPPKRATYIVSKGEHMLTLCTPCTQESRPGLTSRGWEIYPLSRISVAPQLAS